jgi:hypothetical protein
MRRQERRPTLEERRAETITLTPRFLFSRRPEYDWEKRKG